MEIRQGVELDDIVLADIARRYGVTRIALYGSSLRSDHGPDSDVDLLVEFVPRGTPGMLTIGRMELELEAHLGRRVDVRTRGDLSRLFRDEVDASARELYAA